MRNLAQSHPIKCMSVAKLRDLMLNSGNTIHARAAYNELAERGQHFSAPPDPSALLTSEELRRRQETAECQIERRFWHDQEVERLYSNAKPDIGGTRHRSMPVVRAALACA